MYRAGVRFVITSSRSSVLLSRMSSSFRTNARDSRYIPNPGLPPFLQERRWYVYAIAGVVFAGAGLWTLRSELQAKALEERGKLALGTNLRTWATTKYDPPSRDRKGTWIMQAHARYEYRIPPSWLTQGTSWDDVLFWWNTEGYSSGSDVPSTATLDSGLQMTGDFGRPLPESTDQIPRSGTGIFALDDKLDLGFLTDDESGLPRRTTESVEAHAEKLLQKHPLSSIPPSVFPVWYDPTDPQRSWLLGQNKSYVQIVAESGIPIALGLVLGLLGWRVARRPPLNVL